MKFGKKAGLFAEKVYLYRLKFHVYRIMAIRIKKVSNKKELKTFKLRVI